MVAKVDPSAIVCPGMSPTTGASFTAVTVKLAISSSYRPPVSVALKVIDSLPFQSALGRLMVATRADIDTVSELLPLYVHVI